MTTVQMLLRQLRPALIAVAVFTLLCGLVYPAAVWAVSRVDAASAEGSIVHDAAGCPVGSALLAVDPQVSPGAPDPFFHARVVGSSAAGGGSEDDRVAAAMAPGGSASDTPGAAGLPSNKGPSNPELAEWVGIRRALIAEREGVTPARVPVDAVSGSGSGLDPHISPAYAELQAPRVARVLGLPEQEVRDLVEAHTDGRQWGFLGQPRVRVTELNAALGLIAPGCQDRGRDARE
ncbi:potassium-transporting ATPase subunit C [Dietzia lutea]|uniref:Potassium-transporting ATPase KdpC subunit n=2 Tax=Dietzia lutea TaxID=546160 RepID=A0A2S1R9A5_9ACTN|nr:potassium-transporting ATPase subunit C [Dietzia lutea]AWH92878.1 K+-transporting ATPase subunit C [Dietzia lutea]